ncbi:DUF2570 domain-containing protein [Providencia stuartii]|uniref:DUF2570 domain-containing protein n=1 Tax=Providencia stuartii TaxID=588 RepID=UPI000EF8EF6A|nr:DUF2570 domain-containing protein [Providencia stuartii]RMA08715.1 DUF2570 domain-containing protein [Providencia stuartii]
MSKTPLTLAVISIFLVGCLIFLLDKSEASRKRLVNANNQLASELAMQQHIIADQSLQFQRFNQIAASASSRGIQQRADAEERKIEYKTLLKKEPTCDLPVPRDIADSLLNNTYRLRASAMRSLAENTDPASTAIIARQSITYCDLALWVNALLADLEQANTQLMAIEDIEDARQNEKTEQH